MLPNHRILTASPAEYGAIRKIAHATWPDTFGGILTQAQIDYMLGMMYSQEALVEQAAKGHVFLLLLEAQSGEQAAVSDAAYLPAQKTTNFRPVGYASYEVDYLPGTTKLHKLYVLPSCQGKGYGKALMQEVGRVANQVGQKKLRLDVNYQNKAIDVYEHLGFVKLERFNTDIGNGFLMEDWRMERPLPFTK